MKKVIYLIFVAAFLNNKKLYAQIKTSVYDSICSIDFVNYMNKPVDSFLNVLPKGNHPLQLFGHLKNNKIYFLGFDYPDGTEVIIKVKKYRYMNPVDLNRKWNIDLYKKENIFFINVISKDGKFKCKVAS
jgi:hypothetical protein